MNLALDFKIRLLLSSFYFAYFAYVGVMMIYLPKTLYDLGYSAYEIGIIFGIIPLTRFFVPFLFIKRFKLTDRVFTWSLILFLLSAILFYFTITDFTLFLINNIFMGLVVSIIPAYIETFALSHLKKEKYGPVRLWGSVGFIMIAYVLAGYVGDHLSVLHFLVAMVVMTLILSVILLQIDHVKESNQTLQKTQNDPFTLVSHWKIWMSIFLMQVGFGAFYNFFTIYETEQGFGIDLVKYMWIFGVLCEVVMLNWQSGILKRFSLLSLIRFAILMTVLRWMLLFLFPDVSAVSFLSQGFHALSFALYHTVTISYLHAVYKNKKLAQQFYAGFAYGLGLFVGANLAGWTYGPNIFLYSAVITFFAWVVLWREKPRIA